MGANTLGLPSVVLPVKLDGAIPGAVQIIGPRFREDLVLNAAEIIEQHAGVFAPTA